MKLDDIKFSNKWKEDLSIAFQCVSDVSLNEHSILFACSSTANIGEYFEELES